MRITMVMACLTGDLEGQGFYYRGARRMGERKRPTSCTPTPPPPHVAGHEHRVDDRGLDEVRHGGRRAGRDAEVREDADDVGEHGGADRV